MFVPPLYLARFLLSSDHVVRVPLQTSPSGTATRGLRATPLRGRQGHTEGSKGEVCGEGLFSEGVGFRQCRVLPTEHPTVHEFRSGYLDRERHTVWGTVQGSPEAPSFR